MITLYSVFRYANVEGLLYHMSDVVHMRNLRGTLYVEAKETEETAHVKELVQGQKKTSGGTWKSIYYRIFCPNIYFVFNLPLFNLNALYYFYFIYYRKCVCFIILIILCLFLFDCNLCFIIFNILFLFVDYYYYYYCCCCCCC